MLVLVLRLVLRSGQVIFCFYISFANHSFVFQHNNYEYAYKVKASEEFHYWFVLALVAPLSKRCLGPEEHNCDQFPGTI